MQGRQIVFGSLSLAAVTAALMATEADRAMYDVARMSIVDNNDVSRYTAAAGQSNRREVFLLRAACREIL